jgi:putative ABC transport system permease protein
MRPLATIYYCINNKKKVITVIISICVSVFLLYFLQTIKNSVLEGINFAYLNGLKNYYVVAPLAANKPISQNVVDDIKECDYIEKAIPAKFDTTNFRNIIGVVNVPVYSLREADMKYFMDKLNIRIIKGRLPREGTNEIAVNYRIAKNNGIGIGDKLGHNLYKTDPLPGEHEIVGFLDADNLVSLAPLNVKIDNESLSKYYEILVFPQYGKSEELNDFVNKISEKEAQIYTYNERIKWVGQYNTYFNILLNCIAITVIIVVALLIGNSSYIHSFQRKNEFGLLYSLGFSRVKVIKKTAFEIMLMNIIGFMAGIILTSVMLLILKPVYFGRYGFPMVYISLQGAAQVLLVPVITIMFSTIPVIMMLIKIDPITLMEEEE